MRLPLRLVSIDKLILGVCGREEEKWRMLDVLQVEEC
jgi:hypothetical protein